MRRLTSACLAALAAVAGCTTGQEAELRQYRLVVVGPDRPALQTFINSAAANELLRPFQAEGKCKALIWVPRVSVLTAAQLTGANPQPVDLGFFDKVEFVEEAQNAIQSALQQKPALAELDEAAVRKLAAVQLPEAAAGGAPEATAAQMMQAARKLAGRTGVVLYKDEDVTAPAKVPGPAAGALASASAQPRLADKPVAFADAQGYRAQVHDLLCALPAQDGSAVPGVVLLGATGGFKPADGGVNAPELPAEQAVGRAAADAGKATVKAVVPSALAQRAFDRGLAMVYQGDLALALKEFSSAIEHEPAFAAAVANRGVVHLRLKNYGRALDDIMRAIGIEPLNPVWHYNLAAYHALRQEVDRGLDALDQALKLGFAKSDNVQIDALKFGAKGDPDLAVLRKRRLEYCAVLERHNRFLCN